MLLYAFVVFFLVHCCFMSSCGIHPFVVLVCGGFFLISGCLLCASFLVGVCGCSGVLPFGLSWSGVVSSFGFIPVGCQLCVYSGTDVYA